MTPAPTPGRPEAAAAVWRWRDEAEHGSHTPEPGPIRLRGALQAAVGLAVASGFYWLELRGLATAVAIVASIIGLAALVSPLGLFAGFERATAALARGVGLTISWILLVPLFYLFFAPFGLLFRRRRRDRLKRYFEADAATYWEPHEGVTAGSASRERLY